MTSSFPFHSDLLDTVDAGVFHTHPRCRIGQRVAGSSRVLGTGEGRRECPFCFIMRQFQANRALRGYGYPTALTGGVARQEEGLLGTSKEQPYQ